MGEFADFALGEVMDNEDAITDYHRGEMADAEAYDRGIINELGGEERGMTLSPQMKKLGFTGVRDTVMIPRLIVAVSALEKQGKTHFALTAPDPIAFFNLDFGTEGVIDKFTGKEIHSMPVARLDETQSGQAPAEYKRFEDAYNYVIRSKEVRTVVVDTATEVWELLRLARFGKLTQVMPYMYGPVNAEYRALIRKAYDYDKNLILVHKMKQQYVNDKWNGEYERAGFKDTGFLVQVNTQMYRYRPEDGGAFALSILDCRQNPDLAGMELEGEMCTFPIMAQMALPMFDPGVWE